MGVSFLPKNRRARVNLLFFIREFDARSQAITQTVASPINPTKTMADYDRLLYGDRLT